MLAPFVILADRLLTSSRSQSRDRSRPSTTFPSSVGPVWALTHFGVSTAIPVNRRSKRVGPSKSLAVDLSTDRVYMRGKRQPAEQDLIIPLM
jgi:hypothetical protein